MLTASQRRQCAEIAMALDAGNLSLWREAEPSLTAAERGLIWDLRQEQVARAAQPKQRRAVVQNLLPMGIIPQNEALARDLDYWGDDDPRDDDQEPVPVRGPDQRACPSCRGLGLDEVGG